MRVGFIGAGTLTGTFGRHLMTAGHTLVVSNSRGPETLTKFVARPGPGATAGTKQQAVECDVVILATKWVSVPDALRGIDWRGRILIDATNAHDDAKRLVIGLIDSVGFVAVDLESLRAGGSMHEVGAPLSGVELHFVRRLR